MKTVNERFAPSTLSLAMRAVFLAMCAVPFASTFAWGADGEGSEVADLLRPDNYVEIGPGFTSRDSAKFGEYNGLNNSGAHLIGNFNVSGGNAYGGDGTLRWNLNGTDIGTTSRSLGGSLESQGRWSVGVGYDELRHQISDTYQTHLQGAMGSNVFTAPANFGTFNGAISTPTGGVRGLNATQLAAFHNEDVASTRKNISFNAGYHFNQQLNVQFDFNHLDQSGAKLLGSGALGGVVGPLGGTWRAEAVAILMNPTKYQTDTVNLALNWAGEKAYLSAGYFGSFFSNDNDRLTWQNVQMNNGTGLCASGGNCSYQTNTMSTAPNNQFHQINFSGGYKFSPSTRLSGGFSYGLNTQNASLLTGLPEIAAVPQAFDGKVVTTHANLKLTHQASRDLALTAAVKYNERDNQSSSNTYRYYAINNLTTMDAATNAPYSNRKTEVELAGDYRIDKKQSVRLAYNFETISRWCSNMANGFNNCLVSPSSDENKIALRYKVKPVEDLSFNAAYSYADRHSKFDHNAVTPLSGLDTLTPNDVNAQDYPGFIAYTYASRKQDQLRAGVSWQASERFELGLNGRYAKDDYYNSTLGVQDSRTTSINLDATYSYAENGSVSAYVSWQDNKRNLLSGAAGNGAVNTASSASGLVAPTNLWHNKLDGDAFVIGLSGKHRGLLGGKLDVMGDISYSDDKAGYSTAVGYPITGCNAATGNNLNCGDLPDITSRVLTLKLSGAYQIDKSSKIGLGYIYQNRRSNDYYYNTGLYGYTPNRVMPTNELVPNYTVSVVMATYIYSFK